MLNTLSPYRSPQRSESAAALAKSRAACEASSEPTRWSIRREACPTPNSGRQGNWSRERTPGGPRAARVPRSRPTEPQARQGATQRANSRRQRPSQPSSGPHARGRQRQLRKGLQPGPLWPASALLPGPASHLQLPGVGHRGHGRLTFSASPELPLAATAESGPAGSKGLDLERSGRREGRAPTRSCIGQTMSIRSCSSGSP